MTDHPSSWEVGRVQSGRARSWLWNNFFLMMRWTRIMRLYKKRTVNNFHISFFMKRLKLNSKKIKWMQPYISIKTESCYSSLRNWVVWKLFSCVLNNSGPYFSIWNWIFGLYAQIESYNLNPSCASTFNKILMTTNGNPWANIFNFLCDWIKFRVCVFTFLKTFNQSWDKCLLQ